MSTKNTNPGAGTSLVGLNTFCFSDINDPGTYVSNWSGHLIRIPEDAVKPGRSPVIEILGKDPMIVTKLSDDPFLTINKARMIAADHDLEVNF